jgi:hypothetical protein
VAHPKQDAPSIVDVLLGRHHHTVLTIVSPQQRVYHNCRMHDLSLRAEIANAGRHRNCGVSGPDANRTVEDTTRKREH